MYHGDWMNNAMHGKGVLTWNKGEKYEGEFKNHSKHVQIFDFILLNYKNFLKHV